MLPLTPVRILYRARELFGNTIGIVCGDREFTYGEFANRCERLASALRRAGVAAGDRVAYLSLNNHRLMEGYYGAPMAGAIAMPLNVRLSPPELVAILRHAEARVLFYEADFAPLVDALRAQCPSVQMWVALNEEYEALLATGDTEPVDWTAIDENSVAELFYTSGSTGTPKGVMLTHRCLYLHGLSVATLFPNIDGMVDLHTIPLFHANGWGRAHSSTMLGVKQVMVRKFDPAAVLAMIERHRATEMALVPTMANALLAVPNQGGCDVSSLRRILLGGAAASPELIGKLEKAFGCEIGVGYGLTETAPVLTVSTRRQAAALASSDEERWRRQSMAGWPLPGVEVRVVDHNMVDVARDMTAIGEVVARGDHIMAGYYRDPSGTKAVMSGDWFHTGDMAVWGRDGLIHIVDRKKEIIISGGENISSIEVEKAVSAHPEVYECAVVAAPDQKWGEVPVAVVVRTPGSTLSADALLEFLRGRLGGYKMPKVIEFRDDALPKTGTGKIRKLVLKEKYWQGRERRVGE